MHPRQQWVEIRSEEIFFFLETQWGHQFNVLSYYILIIQNFMLINTKPHLIHSS